MKKMLTIALVAVAVTLGGCAEQIAKFKQAVATAVTIYDRVTTATVTPTQIAVAANAFDGVKSVATSYLRYCKVQPSTSICAPGTKDDPGPLRKVISYVRAGTAARNALEPYIVTGGAAPGDIYNALIDSINGLNAQPIAQTGG